MRPFTHKQIELVSTFALHHAPRRRDCGVAARGASAAAGDAGDRISNRRFA
jgi:hypothetical protein